MTPKHRTSREEKIASVLRMLDSDKPGEVVAAVNALKRLLLALGTDFDGLARGFEKILSSNGGAITQAEMNKAISDAYAAGMQDAEKQIPRRGRFSQHRRPAKLAIGRAVLPA